jgi:hypothetical protein
MKKVIAIPVFFLLAAAAGWYALAQERGPRGVTDNAAVTQKEKKPGKKAKGKQGKVRKEARVSKEKKPLFDTPPPGTGYGNLE